MAKDGKPIVPQVGEFWLKFINKDDPYRGFIYDNPFNRGQLMFAEFHFKPQPVTAEMVHGQNGWFRAIPPIEE